MNVPSSFLGLASLLFMVELNILSLLGQRLCGIDPTFFSTARKPYSEYESILREDTELYQSYVNMED